MTQLKGRFSEGCVAFDNAVSAGSVASAVPDPTSKVESESTSSPEKLEEIALLDDSEIAMNELLENGAMSVESLSRLIASRALFPVYFGSALKLQGIDDFLDGLEKYTREPHYDANPEAPFGAQVYKISHDPQGNRLTWLKVTSGRLRVKAPLQGEENASGETWQEKTDQIRLYSGAKFDLTEEVDAGGVCAVTGLTHTHPGEGLGSARNAAPPVLEPVLTYTLLEEATSSTGETVPIDVHKALAALRTLEDEDPLLRVRWIERLQEVHLQLMGEVQLEIIQTLLRERFGLDVAFGPGSILYRETITAPVEGVGHFEPLRHYAEAHILLEPLPQGSGLEFGSEVSLDELDRNWQRLVLAHLREKEHLGVLIGAPLADMRLTLVAGRGHLKHTEGGDFRQATYRAVRQGLMKARDRGECRILEPWYRFRLEVPAEVMGRAMSDIQRMSGTFEQSGGEGTSASTDTAADFAVLEGTAPVSEMRDYTMEVNAYTHGRGHLTCVFAGYLPCHDEEAVIAETAYDPEADLDNTPDSVFCAHGAGYTVKWNRVNDFAHVELGPHA
jgi:translation elongation factor EF-G